MSIKVYIDGSLQQFTGGQSVVEVNGEKVSQCLDELIVRFPSLKILLSDGQSQFWSDIALFLNNTDTFPSQPVADGDELLITGPIGGG
jgi:molybdopterin converting factor small subunit